MGWRNRRWKVALEVGAWISLHFRSSRFQNQTRQLTQTNTTHEGFWFSIIPQELQTRSDLSSLRLQKDNNFTREALQELHQTGRLLWGLKQVLVPVWSPWKANLTHRRQLSLTEGESNFLSLPVIFFGVSSAITDKTRVLAIRASCLYISRENLGQAS